MNLRQDADRSALAQSLADAALALLPKIPGRRDQFEALRTLQGLGDAQVSRGDALRGMANFHKAADLSAKMGETLRADEGTPHIQKRLEGQLQEQIDRGDFDGARATAHLLADSDELTSHLEAVARRQAERGDLVGARRTIARLPEEAAARFSALGALFLAERRLGKTDAAAATLREATRAIDGIEFALARDYARERLAEVVAPGAPDEALALVGALRETGQRARAEARVSAAIAAAGGARAWRLLADTPQARRKVQYAALIAAACTKAGDTPGADRAVQAVLAALPEARRQKAEHPDPVEEAFEALLGARAFSAAIAVVDALPYQSIGFLQVVRAQIEGGDMAGAFETARRSPDRPQRGASLRDIGQALLTARRLPEARAAFQQAADTLRGLRGEHDALGEIAKGLAASGDRDGARKALQEAWKTALNEKHPGNRTGALSTLFYAQNAIAGFDPPAIRVDDALDALRRVAPDTSNVDGLTLEAVKALVRSGDQKRALALARRDGPPQYRAERLLMVAESAPSGERLALVREALAAARSAAEPAIDTFFRDAVGTLPVAALRTLADSLSPPQAAQALLGMALGMLPRP